MTQGLNRVLHKKDIQKQGIWAEKVAKDILIMKKEELNPKPTKDKELGKAIVERILAC